MLKLSKSYLFFILLCIVFPISFLMMQSFTSGTLSDQESWSFILDNMLLDLLKNTGSLALLTVFFSCILGILQATLISFTNIRMKKIFHLLFVLPIIFPLYILSYIYVGSLEFSGNIPTFFRTFFNIDLSNMVQIKSLLGVSVVFSFALSPYVYLFLKSAFLHIDKKLILSAKSLGRGPSYILLTLIIPYSRSWICSSGILVFLEVICDFGGVSVFNYDTFSTAIYHAWISFFSLNTAIKLSSIPLVFTIFLYLINQWANRSRQGKGSRSESYLLFILTENKKNIITFITLIYCFFSVIFPIAQLFHWGWKGLSRESGNEYIFLILQTVGIGCVIAILINIFSIILIFFSRMYFSKRENNIMVLSKIGYAIPSSIIAISIILPLSFFKINYFGSFALIALFWGYLIRFFPVALEMQYNSYRILPKKLDWVSYSLGKNKLTTFFRVHLPVLKFPLIYSMMMIFIEVIKEMPITLILRPYGINTLATKIYELTSEGEWERASVCGSLLILFGLLSVFISECYKNKRGTWK